MQNRVIIEPARKQALARIQQYERLVDIYTFERERLEMIVELALMVEKPVNHWIEYERLKDLMSQFVGYGARHKEISTCQHYEIMLDFIEWLLPIPRTDEIPLISE